MSNTTIQLSEPVVDYMQRFAYRESDVQRALRERTAELADSNMQIAPEQGQWMQLLVQLISARHIIEVGTFTGYSALSMALGLPADGRIVACDVSEEWTNIGREYWERAGVDHKIELRIGPAADTLQAMIDKGLSNRYDLAFIDADKTGYDGYYEQCLQLIHPNGLILIDNVLWKGEVADPSIENEDLNAIRSLNEKIAADERVDHCLVPIADGVTMVRKR